MLGSRAKGLRFRITFFLLWEVAFMRLCDAEGRSVENLWH